MTMRITDEEIEKAFDLQERRDIRRKTMRAFFAQFARKHIPFLHEVARQCKESGDFGIHSFLLPDYYKEPKDKELALFACLLINPKKEVRVQTKLLKKKFGESVFEWYEKRKFVSMGMGRNQNKRLGGKIPYWQIAELFNRIWEIEHPCDGVYTDMESEVLTLMRVNKWTAEESLRYLFDGLSKPNDYDYRLRMLLVCLFRKDGFGYGLWGNGNEDISCPWTPRLTSFLKEWMPDYRKYGDKDECVSFFQFDDNIDFIYAMLGYNKIRKKYPTECSHYATVYRKRYLEGSTNEPYKFHALIPPIDFGD